MKITWLGHSLFELQFENGEVLITDPWIRENPAYPKSYKIKRADVIAISHGHFDHVGDVVPLAAEFEPKVVGIYEVAS